MPLVTAVMITGKNDRTPFVDAAIRAFEAQTYPTKQLVIVSDNDAQVDALRVRQFKSPTKVVGIGGPRSLGELRNEGLYHADGDYVCQWDDDDYYHPERISYQMRYCGAGLACVLLHQVRYSFANDCAFVYRQSRPGQGIHGTVLHHKRAGLEYEKIGKHEDSHFLNTFFPGQALQIINNDVLPEAYIRFHSGLNTWHERHIMGHYSGEANRGKRYLHPSTKKYLEAVLAKEYAGVTHHGG